MASTITERLLAEIRDRMAEAGQQNLAVVQAIRDLIAHRGRQSSHPADAFQPTLDGGIETPYAMADVSIVKPIGLVGKGPDFASVGTKDIHHYTGGEIIVSVSEHKPAALFFYAAEVQVLGMVSNQTNLLGAGVVNNGTGPLVVPIPIGQAYTSITIKARQLVNGIPSSAFPGDTPAMAGASLELAASGRFAR